jgi:hypothetical protein
MYLRRGGRPRLLKSARKRAKLQKSINGCDALKAHPHRRSPRALIFATQTQKGQWPFSQLLGDGESG